jgi:hypothetical protein
MVPVSPVIASHPECCALSKRAETEEVSLSVIPAQAGIQCITPGFRIAASGLARNGARRFRHSSESWNPGGVVRVGHFVSEQRNEAIFVFRGDCFAAIASRNDTCWPVCKVLQEWRTRSI